MKACKIAGDGEPQPRAGGAGRGGEGLEQFPAHGDRHAGAIVMNPDCNRYPAAHAAHREEHGLTRRLLHSDRGEPLLDLAGNDYLGLVRDPRVVEGAVRATEEFGAGMYAEAPGEQTVPVCVVQYVAGTGAGGAQLADQERVAVVAERVGYESEAAFNRAFKRAFGVPPARYRRETRKSAGSHVGG